MARRIVIVQGHPDPDGGRYGHALAQAYRDGATGAGHEVEIIPVAELDFPLLRSKADFDEGTPPAAILRCQQSILHADHLVIIHPLWLGSMPALLKGFLEQVFRPGFAFGKPETPGRAGEKLLKGKSARVIVTQSPSSTARSPSRSRLPDSTSAAALLAITAHSSSFCGKISSTPSAVTI